MTNNPKPLGKGSVMLPTLSLFTATGTLLCCALPALLVTLGMGAVMAGLVGTMPWLIALSAYKVYTFSVAGMLLLAAGYMQWRARFAPCPIDPAQAKACTRLRRISASIYWLSVVLYVVGFFFAFVAPKVL